MALKRVNVNFSMAELKLWWTSSLPRSLRRSSADWRTTQSRWISGTEMSGRCVKMLRRHLKTPLRRRGAWSSMMLTPSPLLDRMRRVWCARMTSELRWHFVFIRFHVCEAPLEVHRFGPRLPARSTLSGDDRFRGPHSRSALTMGGTLSVSTIGAGASAPGDKRGARGFRGGGGVASANSDWGGACRVVRRRGGVRCTGRGRGQRPRQTAVGACVIGSAG